MWEFKECREAIKAEQWSHGKAEDYEKEFKNRSAKQRNEKGDAIADVEDENAAVYVADRDSRRFVTIMEDEQKEPQSESPPTEEYELKDFGNGDISADEMDSENDSLIRRGSSKKETKKSGLLAFRKKEKPRKSKQSEAEQSRLVDGGDDSSV